jgi:hypothetical protein
MHHYRGIQHFHLQDLESFEARTKSNMYVQAALSCLEAFIYNFLGICSVRILNLMTHQRGEICRRASMRRRPKWPPCSRALRICSSKRLRRGSCPGRLAALDLQVWRGLSLKTPVATAALGATAAALVVAALAEEGAMGEARQTTLELDMAPTTGGGVATSAAGINLVTRVGRMGAAVEAEAAAMKSLVGLSRALVRLTEPDILSYSFDFRARFYSRH